MSTQNTHQAWQDPTAGLKDVADEQDFRLRFTIAKELWSITDAGVDAIRDAHDTWLLNTQLPTDPDREACYALLDQCWSRNGEQRVHEYMDDKFVLPFVDTVKLEDIYVLRSKAKTDHARELINQKKNAFILEQATHMETRDDLTHLLRHAGDDGRLKEKIRKLYDKRRLVPKIACMLSKKLYEQLCDEAQSMYGRALLDVQHDRLFVQPHLLKVATHEGIWRILDDAKSERYQRNVKRLIDTRFILDILPSCLTQGDFDSLPRPCLNETQACIHTRKDQVLVLDKLASTTSDSGFRTLYKLASGEETRRAVAEAHLAWIQETYGIDLPESILTDPPPYLVRDLRALVLASV